MSPPDLSVVVATYNRHDLLARLLGQLDAQTLEPDRFEVIVVDDGSREPVGPALADLRTRYALRIERQENRGAAAARHHGVLLARGDVLLITDDDMQIAPDFLARHLEQHPRGSRNVVLGWIRPDPALESMPLFERWYAHLNDKLADSLASGRIHPRGNHLFTGNVSMRRQDYLDAGGFDPQLGRSEDAELGLRLEAAGARFLFSRQAYVLHGSDHVSYENWLRRAYLYGVFDTRISRKHSGASHANPWRFLFEMNPLARPMIASALLAPRATRPISSAAMALARAVDAIGLEKAAFAGSTVVYSMEYFRGIREESGSTIEMLSDLGRYLSSRGHLERGPGE